ncbi:TetR/AcrR family transcriptional regulator [Variovorax sp. RCC_210]|uniref:TetR/AcrR family transcriptional regulator n=1 Tax=Variovorax sp. RCC_210 TaxID=3239217 RepID=UPI0035254DBD
MTDLVVEKGYRGASLDAICERAGYSRGAFHAHFGSRDELMLASLERHLDEEVSKIDAVLKDTISVEELPNRLSRYYAAGPNRVKWCMLQIEFQLYAAREEELAGQFDELLRGFRERIAERIERTFEAKIKLPVSALDLAAVLLAISYGTALQRATDTRISGKAASWGISSLVGQLVTQQKQAPVQKK